jgi:hypothetical protein
MYIERLKDEEINAIIKKILQIVGKTENSDRIISKGKKNKGDGYIAFSFDTAYDSHTIRLRDFEVNLDFAERFKNDINKAYRKFMYQRFKLKYKERFEKFYKVPLEKRYKKDLEEIDSSIEEMMKN